MIQRAGQFRGTRAVRDLGLALRSRPFQLALALSVLLHAALLLALGNGRAGVGATRAPLVRVRIIRTGTEPVAPAPAANIGSRSVVPARPRQEPPRRPLVEPAAAPPAVEPSPQPTEPFSQGRVEEPLPSLPSESAAAAASPEAPAPEAAVSAVPGPRADDAAPAAAPAVSGSGPGAAGAAETVVAMAAAPGTGPSVGVAAIAASDGPGEGTTLPSSDAPSAASGEPVALRGPARKSGSGDGLLVELHRRIDARKVYPQLAVRNGWEGRVLVEVLLEEGGRLADLRLVQGSGYALLDEATLATVRRAAPFPPLEGRVTVPVEYRLTP